MRCERKALRRKAFFTRSAGRTPARPNRSRFALYRSLDRRRQVASGASPAPEVPLLRKREVQTSRLLGAGTAALSNTG